MMSLASREARSRRLLAKSGHRLQKTPARFWTRQHYCPGYMVLTGSNLVVLGCSRYEYDGTIEEIEAFAAGQ